MVLMMCMKPVPGLGEKCPTGKTCVADRPENRVSSKWEIVASLGSLKWDMKFPLDPGTT